MQGVTVALDFELQRRINVWCVKFRFGKSVRKNEARLTLMRSGKGFQVGIRCSVRDIPANRST
jgi:hypothetical protein